MTEKLIESTRARAVSRAVSRWRVSASPSLAERRSQSCYSACLVFAIWLVLGGLGPGILHAKAKTEKFEGTVVVMGPKAITVKSRHNIYMVRTFHYSAKLEQKMVRSKLGMGKKVTVHYVRGSDLALKVD